MQNMMQMLSRDNEKLDENNTNDEERKNGTNWFLVVSENIPGTQN